MYKLTAEDARKLFPKSYAPIELIYHKIKSASEANYNYMWHDLTLEQVQELKEMGYDVEQDKYKSSYRIQWGK